MTQPKKRVLRRSTIRPTLVTAPTSILPLFPIPQGSNCYDRQQPAVLAFDHQLGQLNSTNDAEEKYLVQTKHANIMITVISYQTVHRYYPSHLLRRQRVGQDASFHLGRDLMRLPVPANRAHLHALFVL